MIVKYLAVSLPRRGPGGHILRGMRVVSTSSILLALPRIGPADTTQPPPGPEERRPFGLLCLKGIFVPRCPKGPKGPGGGGIYCLSAIYTLRAIYAHRAERHILRPALLKNKEKGQRQSTLYAFRCPKGKRVPQRGKRDGAGVVAPSGQEQYMPYLALPNRGLSGMPPPFGGDRDAAKGAAPLGIYCAIGLPLWGNDNAPLGIYSGGRYLLPSGPGGFQPSGPRRAV